MIVKDTVLASSRVWGHACCLCKCLYIECAHRFDDCGVNTVASQAQQALLSAAETGSVEIMQLAIAYDCDVNTKSADKVRHKALSQVPLVQKAPVNAEIHGLCPQLVRNTM